MGLFSNVTNALSNFGSGLENTLGLGKNQITNEYQSPSTLYGGGSGYSYNQNNNAITNPNGSTSQAGKQYQGPVPSGYDLQNFRQTGQTVPTLPQINTINRSGGSRGSNGTYGGSALPAAGFTPVNFNGQQYNDAQSLAKAQMDYANQQNQNRPESFLQNLEGTVYKGLGGIHDYYQQLLNRALTNHQQSQSNLDKAYQQGLINFDQRQHGLDLSRQNNLSNISGYFSNISPYAYQSAQNTQEGQANTAYNQDTGNLNTEKGNFGDTYNQNTKGEGQQYQGLLDQYANGEYGATQNYNQNAQSASSNLQNYIDSVKNNLAQYNAQSAATAAANAAATGGAGSGGGGGNAGSAINPGDVAFAEYPNYARDTGAYGADYANQALTNRLTQSGIQPSQPLLDYLKNTFISPSFLDTYNKIPQVQYGG